MPPCLGSVASAALIEATSNTEHLRRRQPEAKSVRSELLLIHDGSLNLNHAKALTASQLSKMQKGFDWSTRLYGFSKTDIEDAPR
jgi:hypothetical protein